MILICGLNDCNQLGEQSNNKLPYSPPFILPPMQSRIDPKTLLSYSYYNQHSVFITCNNELYGIGENTNGQIGGSLERTKINQFTKFFIEDGKGNQLIPISAVCSSVCTLYIASPKSVEKERQLYISYKNITVNQPLFVNINGHYPVSLFGGCFHTAAIDNKGEIIFIHNESHGTDLSTTGIAFSQLPNGEKAVFVAILCKSVLVLSSTGKVYESLANKDNKLNFASVSEFDGIEIACISGTNEHALALSKDGRVFVRGVAGSGRLGIGLSLPKFVPNFSENVDLRKFNIVDVYAGGMHSIFRSADGKLFGCGYDSYGELFNSKESVGKSYSPIETTVTSGATFCITGGMSSITFIGVESPINNPNKNIFGNKK